MIARATQRNPVSRDKNKTTTKDTETKNRPSLINYSHVPLLLINQGWLKLRKIKSVVPPGLQQSLHSVKVINRRDSNQNKQKNEKPTLVKKDTGQ